MKHCFHAVISLQEFADGGDMIDLLQKNKNALTEEKVRFYYRQFGDALRYMHSVVGTVQWILL